MPLTEEQKTAVEAAKTRLVTKLNEVSNTKSDLIKVITCAKNILEDTPWDRDLGGDMADARIESFRAHVISKADMLAPAEDPE